MSPITEAMGKAYRGTSAYAVLHKGDLVAQIAFIETPAQTKALLHYMGATVKVAASRECRTYRRGLSALVSATERLHDAVEANEGTPQVAPGGMPVLRNFIRAVTVAGPVTCSWWGALQDAGFTVVRAL